MAGKKGRSGRRPLRDEERRLKIIDKAWQIFLEYITNPENDLKARAELCSKVVAKDMPTRIEGKLAHVVKMGEITVDDTPVTYAIGDDVKTAENSGCAPETAPGNSAP